MVDPWDKYRTMQKRLLVFVIVDSLLMLGVFAAVNHLMEFVIPLLIMFVALSLLFALISLSNFRCPRCGNHFFYSSSFRNGFTKHCVHCHLAKWSIPDCESMTIGEKKG